MHLFILSRATSTEATQAHFFIEKKRHLVAEMSVDILKNMTFFENELHFLNLQGDR